MSHQLFCFPAFHLSSLFGIKVAKYQCKRNEVSLLSFIPASLKPCYYPPAGFLFFISKCMCQIFGKMCQLVGGFSGYWLLVSKCSMINKSNYENTKLKTGLNTASGGTALRRSQQPAYCHRFAPGFTSCPA